jgi:AcrR family transcriptional regulator
MDTPAGAIARRTQLDRRTSSDGRLLAAALRLVARGGSAGTSLAAIGLEAGFSRGLPAERFGTKLALLQALIDRMEAWAAENVFADLPAEGGLDGLLARVEAHFRGCLDGPEAIGALYILCMESLTVVPELRPRLAVYFQGYRRAFEHHIARGQAKGEIRAELNPAVEALVVLGMIRGLVTQWLLDRDSIDLEVAMRAAVETCRRSLRAEDRR